MGSGKELRVKPVRRDVVSAVLPMKKHRLPLSNLDLLLPPVDFGVFFCYKKPASHEFMMFASVVSTLKASLARVLVDYYPFAGKVVTNSAGEPELLCDNGGVDFVEALADMALRDLDLYDPDETVQGKLMPEKKRGVVAVQATELRCGGMVVACTFDHRITDAYSANMFLASWAEMARSATVSIHPSFCRSLINVRSPGCADPSLDKMYVPVSSFHPQQSEIDHEAGHVDNLVSRIYYITAKHLDDLKRDASLVGSTRTKLESFSAFLWKIVARSAKSHDQFTKMGIVVDGRSRVGNNMTTYFGNVLSIPFGEMIVADLADKPLSTIAEKVHGFLETSVTEEHFLGLIDWVEARRPEPVLAKIYCRGSEEGPAFVISSGQRFPLSKVDFGWGKPAFGSYHFPWGGSAGYVMPMPSPLENGDWIVYMHLFEKQMDMVEAEAGPIFRPLTPDYLGLDR